MLDRALGGRARPNASSVASRLAGLAAAPGVVRRGPCHTVARRTFAASCARFRPLAERIIPPYARLGTNPDLDSAPRGPGVVQRSCGERMSCARTPRAETRPYPGWPAFDWTFAQVSLSVSVRLKTGLPGPESGSGQK